MIKFDASLEAIVRTSGLVAASSDYACMFLADVVTFTTPHSLFFVRNSGNSAQYIKIFRNTGNNFTLDVGGVTDVAAGIDNDPLWIFYRRSGTTHEVYVGGVLYCSVTSDISSWSFDEVYLGTDLVSGNWRATNYQGFREWNTALTFAQLKAEVNSLTPVVTSGLTCDTPLASDYADDSGNGSDWSAIGSPSFVTQGEHLNISGGTIDRTITAAEFNSNNRMVFFHHASVNGYVGFYTSQTSGDFQTLEVKTGGYNDFTTAMFVHREEVHGGWFKLRAGDVLCFEVENAGSSVSGNFAIHFEHAPTVPGTVPNNTIIINDDTATSVPGGAMPATLWTQGGEFLGFVETIPAGEIGGALPNGYTLWFDPFDHNGVNQRFTLLDPDFAIVTTFDLPDGQPSSPFPRITDDGTDFYIMHVESGVGKGRLYKCDITGALTLEATVTAVSTSEQQTYVAIGMKRGDPSILYFTLGNSNASIKRWDVVNDLALSDFYTEAGFVTSSDRWAVTGFSHAGEILVLNDGSLVTWYRDASAGDLKLIHVSSAGTLLATQSYPVLTDELNHLSRSIDPTKVAAWFITDQGSEAQARFTGGLRMSDGDEVFVWTAHLTSAGHAQDFPLTPSPTPEDFMWGPSKSCTFQIYKPTAVEWEPPDPPLPFECPCPCSCDDGGGGGDPLDPGGGSGSDSPPDNATGDVETPVDMSQWTVMCEGPGDVPTAADPSDVESWVS